MIHSTETCLHEVSFGTEELPHTAVLHPLDKQDSVTTRLEDEGTLTATFCLLIKPSAVTDQKVYSEMQRTEAPNTYTCVNTDRVSQCFICNST